MLPGRGSVARPLTLLIDSEQLESGEILDKAFHEAAAPDGLLPVEYADVFGIPFDFTAKPVVAAPQEPRTFTVVKAVSPDRDHLEIRFPRVEGYRTELPAERITAAISLAHADTHPMKAILDPYNPTGSTRHVRFTTTRETFDTGPGNRCHLTAAVLDSGWEGEFCRAVEAHPQVRAYVKNHALGFKVPYRTGSVAKRYRPDFIVVVDDGRPDPLHLVVEIKGFRREDVKDKRNAMLGSWIPGVNRLGTHGRWAFAEFRDVWEIESGLAAAGASR